MKISPLDLRQAQFRRVLRGFDPDEVVRFLDLVRIEMETLRQENQALRDELQQALRRLSEFREKEGMLRDALLTAQRVGDDLKSNAQREADLLIGDAELKASKLVGEAMHKVQELQSQILDLRHQKAALREGIRHLIAQAGHWVDLDEEADEEAAQRDQNLHFFAAPGQDSATGA
ncbi:MAG: DivIVA domain-containing protein [Candidatus Dadabacteria bacterium]|nr:MAG: DivIVA domain-containing protein [Candidatus Dadabacteria bacterium]